MSNHLSPAQTLPNDIVRSIIKWVANESRTLILGRRCDLHNILELLYVSPVWKQEALEYMWRKIDFNIDTKKMKVFLHCPSPVSDKLWHNARDLAKEINVRVDMSDIVSGLACKVLADYLGDNRCFPFVKEFIVMITDYKGQVVDSRTDAINNVLEYANLLKSMAPSATMVDIRCRGDSDPWTVLSNRNDDGKLADELLQVFADVLYANTKRARLDLYTAYFNNLSTIDSFPSLSWFIVSCSRSPDVCVDLVRKSASTLQYLDISLCETSKLLYNENGDAVVYPNLQHLCMTRCVRSNIEANTALTEVAPFPVLKSVRMSFSYQFNDDVLFRDNTKTLEYLSIPMDYKTFVMLNQRQVFEGKHTALQHVAISWPDIYTGTSSDSIGEIYKFLNNLVSAAKIFTVSSSEMAMACIAAMQLGLGFQNIQVFVVRSRGLSIYNVLCLLKALPGLVELRCLISGLGPELENISTEEELNDHVASTYGDVGKNLQIWRMYCFGHQGTKENIDYTLLLAQLCPKLWKLQVHPYAAYSRTIEALNKQLDSKYAPLVNRLLDIICR